MPLWLLFVFGVLGVLLLWIVPRLQTSSLSTDASIRFDKENEARKTLAAVLGGLAVVITLYSTLANLQTTQEGQITDRYTKAIEELGAGERNAPKLEVRLGGIYALDRIAHDSPKDRPTIDEVLSAYLRHNTPQKPKGAAEGTSESRVDYQAIVRILGSRGRRNADSGDRPANLAGVDLAGISFVDGNFESADFHGARLSDADFHNVPLQGANLFGADLQGTALQEANLTAADLRGANLDDARLGGAILREAHLQRASFLRTRLAGADLSGAELEDAHFEGVDLSEARGLCKEQLAHINRDNRTRLPELPICSPR